MKRFLVDPGTAGGDRYSPVIVSPDAIAQRASSAAVIRKVLELTRQLAPDPYTDYVSRVYAAGLDVCGSDWRYMDIVTLLFAVAEMGRPDTYLEIGVRRGRSLCVVAAASPHTDIYGFDIWERNYAGSENPGPELVRAEVAKVGFSGTISFIDGNSHETIPRFLAEDPTRRFDLITVDGDHSVDGAWDDLRNVAPRLAVGGVLIFDDTSNPYCPGLDLVWRDLLRADAGIAGYSYSGIGTGVSFGIRLRPTPFVDVRRKRYWWP